MEEIGNQPFLTIDGRPGEVLSEYINMLLKKLLKIKLDQLKYQDNVTPVVPSQPAERALLIDSIKHYLRNRLGIHDELAVDTWPVANYDIVRRYNRGDKFVKGPEFKNPVIDWQFPDITHWTRASIKAFVSDFFFQYKAGKFCTIQDMAISVGDIESFFYLCLLMMKSVYRQNRIVAIRMS
ncbi:hypothetical protein CPB86DRAFT_802901 [Serendipita vermifera]|nr:hypothetical protein CPB86DRAFT_802901 [Serendipita vermifera]